MKIQLIISLALSILLSCTKEVNITQDQYSSKLSIQGIMEPDSFPIVYINRTTPFLSDQIQSNILVVRNADIKIHGNNQTDYLQIDSTFDWIKCQYVYYYKGKLKSLWNQKYTLDIQYKGEFYTATTTTSMHKTNIDSIAYTQRFNDLYGEHEGIIVYFKDIPNEQNYYRFEQLRPVDTTMKHASIKLNITNGCIGRDTILTTEYGRSVYTDVNQEGQQIKIVIEPAFSHRNGLKTKIRIHNIDKASYDFLDQIDKQKLAQFNPFVEPIFLREGQFGNKAWGYFGSRIRSDDIEFVFPE